MFIGALRAGAGPGYRIRSPHFIRVRNANRIEAKGLDPVDHELVVFRPQAVGDRIAGLESEPVDAGNNELRPIRRQDAVAARPKPAGDAAGRRGRGCKRGRGPRGRLGGRFPRRCRRAGHRPGDKQGEHHRYGREHCQKSSYSIAVHFEAPLFD